MAVLNPYCISKRVLCDWTTSGLNEKDSFIRFFDFTEAVYSYGHKQDVFALGWKVSIGWRWCGEVFADWDLLGEGGREQIEKEREREAVSRLRPCQLSAVPGWNLPGVNRMWKISRHRPDHSRNARFKHSLISSAFLSLSFSPSLSFTRGSGICGGRREGEKRGFENETWDDRAVFGMATTLEGGILQPWQICNYLSLTQTFVISLLSSFSQCAFVI